MASIGKDYNAYVDEWTRTQIQIWMERIERLRIIRSGRLHQSFRSAIEDSVNGKSITMRFFQYGLYQEMGVGYRYERGNGGDLPFLGKEYRELHGLDKPRRVGPAWGGYMTSGKPRVKRKWFSRALMRSLYVMREDLARITGDELSKVMCSALSGA